MHSPEIVVRGAREHNLQDVSLSLPRNQLVVMTGVSGSGKSSLAFDTLYAEGQRRYVESLSTYARQFLGQMPKPDVDSISGLSPSISIQQKSTSRNPRSTVGTITEILDYLRVLYARAGQGYCYVSGLPIRAQTTEQIVETLLQLPDKTRFTILAPVIQGQKGEFRDLFADLLKRGFLRARVDGEIVALTDDPGLKRHHKHDIEVVVDRLTAGPTIRNRLSEAVETALRTGDGQLICSVASEGDLPAAADSDRLFSAHYACPESGMSYEPPSPRLFSFNSPAGMCPGCEGLGQQHSFPDHRVVLDARKSIRRGALLLLPQLSKAGRWPRHIYQGAAAAIEKDLGLEEGSVLKTPWEDLPAEAQRLWLYGTGDRQITFLWKTRGSSYAHGGKWDGWIRHLLETYRSAKNSMRRRQLEKHMETIVCPDCGGGRLNRQAQHVLLRSAGRKHRKSSHPDELSLPNLCALTIEEAWHFFEALDLDESRALIAEEALKEIRGRLGFLLRCGLHYLTLDRPAPTLSGGELQRIRLAAQIGCGLVGVVYILDEPSIGLHPRDNEMLLGSIQRLRDQGNTVIVVEHDEDTMRAADHIVDFGPGPGNRGGAVVAEGTLETIRKAKNSLTADYLTGRREIPVPETRRTGTGSVLRIRGPAHNNLKGEDVEFPLGSLICVTGVSGSGKSSLINHILWPAVNSELNGGKGQPGDHAGIDGLGALDRAIDIDQSPIGRTPRSNPATYIKVFDEIRKLFAGLPDARVRGYQPGRFSFNVAGGRCEACEGHGATRLEMDFLADIWVPCPVCEGRRFSAETLEIRFKGHSIADILKMEVAEAIELFEAFPKVSRMLTALKDVGLDYMQLGQPSPTLSGGEAQRIKLARELGKRSTGNTLYLLDEPTTGLHFADVDKLLEVLHGLVDAGNTVIVIEHHLDVIKTADHVIDLGPDGGAGGGRIIAAGTPEEVARCRQSHTGTALRKILPGMKPWKRPPGTKRTAGGTDDPFVVTEDIVIEGASQHNLQHVNVAVPREKMTVFSGPSGSGKTSLAMDTLYAEGRRRYVESLSAYARQFLGRMPKPAVERINGLSPAVAIEQKTVGATPRSTVGTVTEIYDYLRVLYARLGAVWCPTCEQPATQQTTDQIVDSVLAAPEETRLLITAPVKFDRTTSFEKMFRRLQREGYARVRVDGRVYAMEEVPELDHRREHQVAVVVDRVTVRSSARGRITDSVETALNIGRGFFTTVAAKKDADEADWPETPYSLYLSCHECGSAFDQPDPRSFSFNGPLGWCPACEGLGTEYGANQSLIVTGSELSLREGAIGFLPGAGEGNQHTGILDALCEALEIRPDVPWYLLSPREQRTVLYGDSEVDIPLPAPHRGTLRYKGIYPAIAEAARVSYDYRSSLRSMAGEHDCSLCNGTRLQPVPAAVRLRDITLPQLCRMPLDKALEFLKRLRLTAPEKRIAGDLLNESQHRLTFLTEVGLSYLTLDRGMPTLSGGESQRIRLAGQIGRSLTGVLYVLDEPTIGLHPRDNGRLLEALRKLRDLGNTVLMVEHDREVLEAADRIVDFGPAAGRHGGTVVAEGTPSQVRRRSKGSLTGRYLSGKASIPVPTERRIAAAGEQQTDDQAWLELLGASQNNLRSCDLRIPLKAFTCITGVSGSGKSTLIMSTLAPAVGRALELSTEAPGAHRDLNGVSELSKLSIVDQDPIGNTPASNPATYTGVFEEIRKLFCRMPEARVRGYRPGRFSFNRPGGRCEECEGMGQKKIEMHFLPDVWVECPDCRGKRFNEATLQVLFRNYSIADVLEMPIDKASEVFADVPKIHRILQMLNSIGLGYLNLGQSAPTLSGGESQRLKLAAELARPQHGRTLYLLDEPTTGLHMDDIARLLIVLNSLVEQGNTVLVIEHNLDVIKTADWVVDLGPDAGRDGGRIVVSGTPEDLVEYARTSAGKRRVSAGRHRKQAEDRLRSWTGELLADVLKKSETAVREVVQTYEVSGAESAAALKAVEGETQLPWEADGPRWHLKDRVAHSGQPCRWDGEALRSVLDRLAAIGTFQPVNWNHRSTVELKADSKTTAPWFLHARTGGEWLLSLCFRVGKGCFETKQLDGALNLTPLNNLDEVHVYGNEPRAKARNIRDGWQEVTIKIWKQDEVETPAFREFLQQAVASFEKRSRPSHQSIAELQPWKKLGPRWHAVRKGLPRGGRIAWEFDAAPALIELLTDLIPEDCRVSSTRYKLKWTRGGKPLIEVLAKRPDALRVYAYVSADSIAVGQIVKLADSAEVSRYKDGIDRVEFDFTTEARIRAAGLRKFLTGVVTGTF